MVTTIAVPLDGSPLAERALLYAEALVRKTGAKLIVVHARPALAPTWEPRFEPGPVAGRLHSSGVDAEAQVCLIYGDETARAICEAGKERRADLIIMSTHGHGGLRRWGYGSVADAVLRLAQMPVLLVPATCQRPWPTDLVLRILVPLDGLAPAEDVLGQLATWLRRLALRCCCSAS